MLCSQSITVLKSHGRHGYMYIDIQEYYYGYMYTCRQEYWDRHERAADVLNGVHVEHRLAMHKGFTYHAAIWLAW